MSIFSQYCDKRGVSVYAYVYPDGGNISVYNPPYTHRDGERDWKTAGFVEINSEPAAHLRVCVH